MKKLFSQSRLNFEFALISVMFVLSFITFQNTFSRTKDGDYFREVIAALIGTLLTVIISFVLLKHQLRHQQENEEVKERNIEVFKKRVARYEEVTQLLIDVLEDGIVDEAEAKKLKNAIYNLALLSSEKTIETISHFLRNCVVEDEQNDIGLFDVISCFRSDLKLEGIVDEFSTDHLEAVDVLLAAGFNKKERFREIQTFLARMRISVRAEIENEIGTDAFGAYKVQKVQGKSDRISFDIDGDESIWSYEVVVRYPKSEEIEELGLEVIVWSKLDLAEMQKEASTIFKEEIEHTKKIALVRGFEWNDKSQEEEIFSHFYKRYPLDLKKLQNGSLSINDQEVHKLVAEDVVAIEAFVDPNVVTPEDVANDLSVSDNTTSSNSADVRRGSIKNRLKRSG